ncbi:MAG: PBP1A family penicillin-binding protein [Acidobacteriota bacterium]
MKQQVKLKRKSLWRRILTPRVVFLLGLMVLALTGVFAYFYVIFSEMIDAKLQGNIFVRATGIYAAPLKVKTGQGPRKTELINYLEHIGYLSEGKPPVPERGRYLIKGTQIEIEPSSSARIDGRGQFPSVRLKYSDDGQRVLGITDLMLNKNLDGCLLEPELLTAVNREREKRKIVEFKDLPDNLVKSIIAIEDRRFFDHPGIDFRGLFRALWRNVEEGELQQGGSTITQQLVKNFFLTPERTFKRKFSEAFISVLLETRLTKEQIFQMYCNEIYLGQDGSYSINGVGEAAKFYFNKDVINLSLSESAFLAGVIRGPGYYSPFQHPRRAVERRNQVLDAMVVANSVDAKTAEDTKKINLQIRPKSSSSNAEAPYFLDYIQTKVNERFTDKFFAQQSYRIYTTIDMELQRAADRAVRDGLIQLEKDYSKRYSPGSLQAALIAMSPKTGEILAMVGGRDYSTSQLNRVTEAHRQPGSVFKPIVYTTALSTKDAKNKENIITAASKFLDAKEIFTYGDGQTYEPDNYGMDYSNELTTVREALTRSLNVVTVRVAEKTGYWKVADMAEKFGLPKPQPFPALALGTTEATPLEVARAYTVFPNLGTRIEPLAISRITDSDGQTIFQDTAKQTSVIEPQVAFIVNTILQDVINRGTGARSRALGFKELAAGKTGTSRDGWFAGYTPNLVCVVYVGFDDNSQLGLEGSKAALPIWTEFMKKAVARRPELGGDEFPTPKPAPTKLLLDRNTGLLSTEQCSDDTYEEYFVTGTEPKENCESVLNSSPDEGEEGFPPTEESEPAAKPDDSGRPRRLFRVFKRPFERRSP